MKITPGPWRMRSEEDESGEKSYFIATDNLCYGLKNHDDALLVAAAPEMFKAIEILMESVSCQTASNFIVSNRKEITAFFLDQNAVNCIIDAYYKAKGEGVPF